MSLHPLHRRSIGTCVSRVREDDDDDALRAGLVCPASDDPRSGRTHTPSAAKAAAALARSARRAPRSGRWARPWPGSRASPAACRWSCTSQPAHAVPHALLGVDEPGAHGVDADAVLDPLHRHALHQARDGALRAVVEATRVSLAYREQRTSASAACRARPGCRSATTSTCGVRWPAMRRARDDDDRALRLLLDEDLGRRLRDVKDAEDAGGVSDCSVALSALGVVDV